MLFPSHIVHGHTKTMLWGNNMYLMMAHRPRERWGTLVCSNGLCMANTYTEMTTQSKSVAIVIKNQTAAPITIDKGINITQVVATNRVPPVDSYAWKIGEAGQNAGNSDRPRWLLNERKEMILQQLQLSGLEGWSGTNCTSAHALLIKYHDAPSC